MQAAGPNNTRRPRQAARGGLAWSCNPFEAATTRYAPPTHGHMRCMWTSRAPHVALPPPGPGDMKHMAGRCALGAAESM